MGTAGLEPAFDASQSDETGTGIEVHAGFPNPAADRAGTPLSLDRLLIRHPSSTYLFRIRGHHWQRFGVFDGDLAVIDRALDPGGRDLIIWWSEQHEGFMLSRFSELPSGALVWGCITSIIHETRAKSRSRT